MRRFSLCFLAGLLLGATPAWAATPNDTIGIVLMHGKLGSPQFFYPRGVPATGGKLLGALKSAGYRVEVPEMCWSGTRQFDRPYPDCLGEIDKAVASLKAQGATRIVIAGQSLGGNASIAYGTLHPELLGIIGFAPADNPVGKVRRPEVAASLASAKSLMGDGKGDQKASFDDVNTGAGGSYAMKSNTTPRIFLSFNDPETIVNFPMNLPKLTVPMLWVAGNADPTEALSKEQFGRLRPNPLNRYVPVQSNHLGTPDAGTEAALAWLAELPRS